MKKTELIEIFLAQKGNCFYCHQPMVMTPGSYRTSSTRDHFRAKSKGYSLYGNTVLAHEPCNSKKRDRDPTKRERQRFKEMYRKIFDRKERLNKMLARKHKKKGADKSFGKW